LDITDPDERSGTTPLHLSAAAGHLNVVKFLYSKAAKMDVKDKRGRTPLHYSCQNGHTEVVRFLHIDCKSDKNSRDFISITPIVLATMRGHTEIIKVFQEGGTTPNPEEPIQSAQREAINRTPPPPEPGCGGQGGGEGCTHQ
jgi:ankyrin repeat protein